MLFHCRRPCPASSGVNGNGKIIILCVLCVSSEAPQERDRQGGEYKLTYLQSKAWTISIAKGLKG